MQHKSFIHLEIEIFCDERKSIGLFVIPKYASDIHSVLYKDVMLCTNLDTIYQQRVVNDLRDPTNLNSKKISSDRVNHVPG